MNLRGDIQTFSDSDAASRAGAESFARLAREAVEARGRFTVALSGGDTPRPMYEMLAREPLRSRIPWDKVHIFFGDDRMVPPGHARSNFRMAHRAFLAEVPIPEAQVYRMRGEEDPTAAAKAYESELRALFGAGTPRFDLIHLGIGEDAHCASLFPFDTGVLREQKRSVVPALFSPLGEWRLTFTLPVLNGAARVEFLVLEPEKAGVVRRVARGALDPVRLPAQSIRPSNGEMFWMLSPEAAVGVDG